MNISNHIIENPRLYGILGFGICAYLGSHAIKWVIKKCNKTQIIHNAAQRIFSTFTSSTSSKSIKNRVSNLNNDDSRKITVGQGDYIVFRKSPEGEKQPLSREEYDCVYKTLREHSPGALITDGSQTSVDNCVNRYELLKSKIKEYDSSVEIVFIPKTLYELLFIRKCIEEDVQNNGICPFVSPTTHNMLSKEFFKGDQKAFQSSQEHFQNLKNTRNCWHLCCFEEPGDHQPSTDSEHANVKEIAYRLNQVAFETFNLNEDGFTIKELAEYSEQEIQFLKKHHETNMLINTSRRGPTTNFSSESFHNDIKPMGLRNDADAQIIRNAISLDCSDLAQRAFLVYRGAVFKDDAVQKENKPFSLSYGSSLFAGCLYDGGATSFHYMRNEKNAYAIPIPFEEAQNSPFFVPTTHTVVQLFGHGEVFHARTKAWQDFDVHQIGGIEIGGTNSDDRDHLTSNLTQAQLTSAFQGYKKQAIQLK